MVDNVLKKLFGPRKTRKSLKAQSKSAGKKFFCVTCEENDLIFLMVLFSVPFRAFRGQN
jgi:hypothetical protein